MIRNVAVVRQRRITWSCGIGADPCHGDQAGRDDQTGCDIRFEPSIECAAVFRRHCPVPASIARKVAKFAPFQAVVLALLLRPIAFPEGLDELLSRLGATLAPLALVSVGYQLRLADLAGRIPALTLGLLFKLVFGPILITLILVKLLGVNGQLTQVTIFEAAMAPQIGAAIVAMEHKLDPPLVTLMVGIGIPLSFLTLPIWWYVLQGI